MNKDNNKVETPLIDRNGLASMLCMSRRSTHNLDGLPKSITLKSGKNSKKLWLKSEVMEFIKGKQNA